MLHSSPYLEEDKQACLSRLYLRCVSTAVFRLVSLWLVMGYRYPRVSQRYAMLTTAGSVWPCQIRRSGQEGSNRARPSGRSNGTRGIGAVQATMGESEKSGSPFLYRRFRKNHKTTKQKNHNLWSRRQG